MGVKYDLKKMLKEIEDDNRHDTGSKLSNVKISQDDIKNIVQKTAKKKKRKERKADN